jgi:AcrR family transcriptional regulator
MTPAARADAVRSRARILDAARAHDPGALRLNDVAREAGVGVGTVYRHFPTTQALVEALSIETLRRLRDLAERATAEPDARTAMRTVLKETLDLQLEDGGLQAVLTAAENAEGESRMLRDEVFSAFGALLARAQEEGSMRADVTVEQLQHLVCGIEHAVRLGSPADRPLLLDILLAGLELPPESVPVSGAGRGRAKE